MIQASHLFLIASVLAITVSSKTITSPDVCLSNLECPPTSFCNDTFFTEIPVCAPRRQTNEVCNNSDDECKEGLRCVFNSSIDRRNPVCRPVPPRGANCNVGCVRPLACEPNSNTCQPFTTGFADTPCSSDSDCQQDEGFFCKQKSGVCTPKRRPGGKCGRAADNNECLGFCASPPLGGGVCLAARKEGELCTETSQCENLFFQDYASTADRLECNIPRGLVGRCVRELRLINRLGVECDPNFDRCDARRSLSCRPTDGGLHVCQQRTSRFDRQFQSYCDPNSNLSRCPFRDEKAECRLEGTIQGQVRRFGFGPSPLFGCNRKLELVPRGGVCLTEYAACANGTECRLIPNVLPQPGNPLSGRFQPQEVAYCVQIVQQGGACGAVNDKFTTQCEEGLRCANGTCVTDDGTGIFEATHAGLRAPCSDLPCAPGLVCEKDERDSPKRCVLPLRIVGKGRACTDRAVERRRCESGLVCVFRNDGRKVRRCREPRQAGDYCQLDEDCPDGLVCPRVWTGNRDQQERRCYDPNKTLKLGDACDPKANASLPGCVVNQRPDRLFPRRTNPEPMRCVMKGDGFACRVIVGLFEVCDEAQDIACDRGMKCGNLGVCVPVGET